MALCSESEPHSYQEAIQNSCWKEAMKSEIDVLVLNKTWEIIVTPPRIRPIGCRWVYKIKKRTDGAIEHYKARFVAKGFTQIEDIEYFETFSLEVRMATIRLVLTLATIHR
jgi:histone deacetylase 1/2